MPSLRVFPLLLFVVALFPAAVTAQDVYQPCGRRPATSPLIRAAQAVALVDGDTGALLYESQGTRPWPPASLTKLVAIYTAFDAAGSGRFSLADQRPVDPRAYASATAPGSSLMFLGPDNDPTGADLISGLVVSSGNDAAVELALRVSGSVENFVEEMNRRCADLGFSDFRFFDPAGLSSDNRITAIGFARFLANLVRIYPEILDYTATTSFTWPPEGAGGITQENRNGLVSRYAGADGLKTGYIEESGYNIAVTARRDGLRLIAVVLGVEASSHAEGGRLREVDAEALLDWGFDTWENVPLAVPDMEPVELFGGDRREVSIYADVPAQLLMLREDVPALRGELTIEDSVWAPIPVDDEIGTVRYLVDECVVAEYPIRTLGTSERGGVVRRISDRLRWWWRAVAEGIRSIRV